MLSRYLAIGKKGGDILSKQSTLIDSNNEIYDDLTFDNVAVIAEKLMSLFADGTYDKIELFIINLKMQQLKYHK